MVDERIGVSALFKRVFGINTPIFLPWAFKNALPPNLKYDDINTNNEIPFEYKAKNNSWMGTPIMFEAEFEGLNYNNYKADGTLEKIQMENYNLPPATVFQFRRAKNIVRTNVLGSSGTVKELYGYDDWVIDVKGICLTTPDRYAMDQLTDLIKWTNLADSIKVNGHLFSICSIENIVINDFNFNILQGSDGDAVSFEMQWFSDNPSEFKIF
ncbi:hypothetical protein HX049_05155 [Myroides odoratimimus]|uniref:DUF6046 domain-containing protein n=1 Tax=Myroides odoratimimus TaxID=76832 RepID=UPI0025750BFD|nr:DUF6046 domain-containing protein [Myroides odoratimimus]MDM1396557.1 hypothetical protein [Myroides odoratimimus]